MNFSPLNIFGLIMSAAYIFFGLIILMTPMFSELVEDPTYRKVLGAGLLGYGLFRVMFFVRKIRNKL